MGSNARKPLSLWSKPDLSTVWWPFTITTNLYIYSSLLIQRNRFAWKNPRKRAESRPDTARRKSLEAGRTGRQGIPENSDPEQQTQQDPAIALSAKAQVGTTQAC
jgi:hypothetical protein